MLFVHGITSNPDKTWRDGRDSIGGEQTIPADLPTLASQVRGLSSYMFDYGRYSLDWVDDPHIGPKLGKSITCLARASGNPVTVIAHSMGGLATEYASRLSDGDGGTVARHLRMVITLGTPYHGSLLLTALEAVIGGGVIAGNPIARAAAALVTACGIQGKATPDHIGPPCWILGVPNTPAGRALVYKSPQVEALHWANDTEVHALRGDIDLNVTIGIRLAGADIGDIPVSPDSAAAGGSTPEPDFTHCSWNIVPTALKTLFFHLVGGILGDVANGLGVVRDIKNDPCYHDNLVANAEIVHRVLELLQRVPPVAAPTQPVSTQSNGASATELVVDVSGSMDESAGAVSKMDAAKRASSDVLQLVSAEQNLRREQAGVVTFSDDSNVAAPVSDDLSAAAQSVESLSTEAGTNMGAGIQSGLDELARFSGPKTMILLSDGETNEGLSRAEILSQLVPAAVAQDVKIDAVALGDDDVDTDLLSQIAAETGGTYTATTSLSDLRQAFVTNEQSANGVVIGSNQGTITAGQVIDAKPILVPDGQRLLEVSLTWDTGAVALRLTDPGGHTTQVHLPDGFQADAATTSGSLARGAKTSHRGIDVIASNPEVVLVRDPRPGKWKVQIVAQSIPSGETAYFTVASRQNGGVRHIGTWWHGAITPGIGGGVLLILLSALDAVVVRRRASRLALAS